MFGHLNGEHCVYRFFQLSRLSELEEMVAEQDNALAVAAEKYKKSRNEISKMKKEHEEQVNNLKQQMARSLKLILYHSLQNYKYFL